MNHYCTYFDRNFLIQGMALAGSLRSHDRASVLWVLCLDEFTHEYLRDLADAQIRPIPLSALEEADAGLLKARDSRSRVEYFFTLSPCWPRFLLQSQRAIDRITYVDADLFFFASPDAIFEEMGAASVFVTEHRHPAHLSHHRRFGRFNVGILSFRNDPHGLRCLDRWREQCLEWCEDTVDTGRYADQAYLNDWPALLGEHLCISRRAGVNLAPWNWSRHRVETDAGRVLVDAQPLEIFHFARFRPQAGSFLFQSGQLEYGIMPWRIRQAIYGAYWRALQQTRTQIRALRPGFNFPKRQLRGWHSQWKALIPRLVFGSDWWRIGSCFISGRFSLGRYSGQLFAYLRKIRHAAAATQIPESPPLSHSRTIDP